MCNWKAAENGYIAVKIGVLTVDKNERNLLWSSKRKQSSAVVSGTYYVLTLSYSSLILPLKGSVVMAKTLSVATMPKTTTFQVRINPEVKAYVEDLYARCGMTLTDAFNAFLQQSINVDGLPFLLVPNSKELLREQALQYLMTELEKGEASAKEHGYVSEEEVLKRLGLKE